MANRILVANGWESRIRSKLGTDAAYLPDADIQQPDIITVAEASIIAQVPNYASLADDDKVWLEAATVCACAVLLCPSMPARLPVKEQGPHFTQELNVNWDKKQQDLEIERDGFVSKINGSDAIIVPRFGLAGPRR